MPPKKRSAGKPRPANGVQLRPRLRLLVGNEIAMGPGKAELLELIRETGSIAAAARRMGMSYKRAWTLVATMNQCFAQPVVTAARGGTERGGAEVSKVGEQILATYRRMMVRVENAPEMSALRRLLADTDPTQD